MFHLLKAPFLPKLQDNFAEFLSESSLERLRILSSPTCVGLRYGHHSDLLRGFSWQTTSPVYGLMASLSPPGVKTFRICLERPPSGLAQHTINW